VATFGVKALSGAAGWAALAGLANYIGGRMENDREMEQKQKLYQMQQDAEMKRQQFLAQFQADLSERNKQADDERSKDDIEATFTDPETGNIYGRTKSGNKVMLNQTSDDYQNDIKSQRQARLSATQGRTNHLQALGSKPDYTNPNYGTGTPAPNPNAEQTSPTQPAAPSVEQLLAQANAAAKAVGNDPQKQAAIEARLKQLMVQYGYQPQ
jgi:hypothetical protein